MKTMKMPVNTGEFKKAMRQAAEETVVLTSRGRPVAAVVPIKGVDAETFSLSTNRKFLAILRRSFRQLDAQRTVPLAEMRRRLES